MVIRNICCAIMVCVVAVACSSVNVSTDYDEAADFSALSKFTWYVPDKTTSSGQAVNAIMDARIRRTIENRLVSQGFQSGASGADFLINYSVTTQDKVDISTYHSYGGYGSGWGWGRGYGYRGMAYGRVGISEVDVREYRQGTLIIDVIDADSQQLVWRGMGSRNIPEKLDPAKADKLVGEVVSSILANFPPQ